MATKPPTSHGSSMCKSCANHVLSSNPDPRHDCTQCTERAVLLFTELTWVVPKSKGPAEVSSACVGAAIAAVAVL